MAEQVGPRRAWIRFVVVDSDAFVCEISSTALHRSRMSKLIDVAPLLLLLAHFGHRRNNGTPPTPTSEWSIVLKVGKLVLERRPPPEREREREMRRRPNQVTELPSPLSPETLPTALSTGASSSATASATSHAAQTQTSSRRAQPVAFMIVLCVALTLNTLAPSETETEAKKKKKQLRLCVCPNISVTGSPSRSYTQTHTNK